VIRFGAPWLLAMAAVVFALLLWRLAKLPHGFGGRRRAIQLVLGLAGLAATLAVGDLQWGHRVDRLAVVYVLDRSRSVADEETAENALQRMREANAGMRSGDRAGLVVVGATAATDLLPSPEPPFGTVRATVPRDATDLAAGLRRALADLPADHAGRIVLISDGVQNRGDALEVATVAAGRGVGIDVLPVDRTPTPEVAVERVTVPRTARPGEPVEVRVVTRASRATPARVRVTRGGQTIAEAITELREGADLLVLRDEAPEAGVHRYDVLVEPMEPGLDAGRENNEGGAFLRVTGNGRVLVVAGEPTSAEALAAALRSSGMQADLVGPSGMPASLGALAGYDLLVLADVEARAFATDQLESIQSYVRDLGGGLLMAGARDAFGLGGYTGTPVEDALPARFDLRQRRDRLSLAMVIAIDKSGSMTAPVGGGRTKLDLANEAAARSASLLSPSDRVGVMHVDTAVTWTQGMVSVEDPAAIAAIVRRAQPGGGGIDVDVAMEAAYGALAGERTQLKHFLLFSDGEDSQRLEGTREMVRRALRDGATTSIVSMGNGTYTPELEHLSRLGEGRFYIVENLQELPRIFTQETIEASRAALVDDPFRASARSPSAVLRGVDLASAPALGGYAVVDPRSRAEIVIGADDDDPLLAVWQHGVGRSAIFTTDVGAELGRPWLAWSGYPVLFDQLGRSLARSPERADARVSLSIENGVGHVRVEAIDAEGRYRNYLDLGGTVAGPGGTPLRVDLRQTGAGRYEGTFSADAPGPYLVTVNAGESGLVGSAGAVRPSGEEMRGEGTDHALLAQVAALSGGVVREGLSDVFRDRPPEAWAHESMWPALVVTALLLMLLSVALRRLVLPPGLVARFRRRKRTARATMATAGGQGPAASPRVAAGPAGAPAAPRADAPERAAPPAEEDRPRDSDPPPPAAQPSSLAEQLLARKKTKR